jgi:hypothetical protein
MELCSFNKMESNATTVYAKLLPMHLQKLLMNVRLVTNYEGKGKVVPVLN